MITIRASIIRDMVSLCDLYSTYAGCCAYRTVLTMASFYAEDAQDNDYGGGYDDGGGDFGGDF